MKRYKQLPWLVATIVALAGLSVGVANAAAPDAADEAAIRARTASAEKAYNGADATGVATQYAGCDPWRQ